jgi:hypothetical protein
MFELAEIFILYNPQFEKNEKIQKSIEPKRPKRRTNGNFSISLGRPSFLIIKNNW